MLVIYRRAEVRQHPLVDGIFAIITLQISDPSAGECRPETIGLRDRPHGHVAAIAPARNSHAMIIHRIVLHDIVHASQNIAQISVPEIPYVGPGEGFALPVTSAWIREKDEVTLRRH